MTTRELIIPCDSQPQEIVSLNPNSSLSEGFFGGFINPTLPDLRFNQLFSAALPLVVGPFGQAISSTSSSATVTWSGNYSPQTTEMTVLVRACRFGAQIDSGFGLAVTLVKVSGSQDPFQLFIKDAGERIRFNTTTQDSSNSAETSTNWPINTWQTGVYAWRSGSAIDVYRNNVKQTLSLNAYGAGPTGTLKIAQSLRINNATLRLNGAVAAVMIWSRKLTPDEIAEATNNLESMFQRTISVPLYAATGFVSVTKDLSLSYLVRTTVAKDIALAYNIRSAVISDNSLAYVIRESVVSDATQTYQIRTAITSDNNFSYSIRTAVSSDQAQSYSVRTSVLSSFEILYNVLSSTEVIKNLTIDYKIRTNVSSDGQLNYNILSYVQKDQTSSYTIRAALSKDLTTDFKVRTFTEKDAAITYKTRESVISDTLSTYKIRQAVASDLQSVYVIRTTVEVLKDLQLLYSIFNDIPDDSIIVYLDSIPSYEVSVGDEQTVVIGLTNDQRIIVLK